jgi:polysaccharide biosynthesis protein PslH
LASALARRCSVTLLQVFHPGDVWRDPPEPGLFEKLVTARKKRSYSAGVVLKGLLGPLPVTVLNFDSPDVAGCLRTALAEHRFDSVQMESCNLSAYLETIRAAPGSPAVVLDWHNIDSELMQRYASETKSPPRKFVARRTANLLLDLETRLLGLCDAHSVVSDRDKAALLERNPAAKISVIPNGVDASEFSPLAADGSQDSLLYVGSMDYHANINAVVWFVRNVWPEISARYPSLRFVIVGRSPAREVQVLATDRILVTGTVDDVRPFYARACAVVAPLRVGGGTRLKILEAMAMGVPVISTTLGAEGISITPGRNILLADSEQAMVQAIARVLEDSELRRQLSFAGRTLAAEHYDWRAIGDRLFELHQELVSTRVAL